MPVPCPPQFLPEAFRVMCMRAARQLMKGNIVNYDFSSANSQKCDYCIYCKDKCNPVPVYAREEYLALIAALEAYKEVQFNFDDDAEGVERAHQAMMAAGVALDDVVQVTTGIWAREQIPAWSVALTDEIRGVRSAVVSVGAAVGRLSTRVEELVGSCDEISEHFGEMLKKARADLDMARSQLSAATAAVGSGGVSVATPSVEQPSPQSSSRRPAGTKRVRLANGQFAARDQSLPAL